MHPEAPADGALLTAQQAIIPNPSLLQGAQHVRCACCHHITEVSRLPQPAAGPSSAPQPAQDMAQLTCTNPRCRVTLTYPRGASQVHCAMCGTLNDAGQVGGI